MTPSEQKVFDFVQAHQPCSVKDLINSGFQRRTAANILAKSKFYKRKPAGCINGGPFFVYWIDDEFEPIIKRPELKKEPVKHPLLHEAFWGRVAI